ncbi:MAG: SDR family oxidoreductase [Ectothiorhodospiraceae bacterium]|nr:SDR family oxidoreductase [Ectothiorhodospiraceae bacterium]
MTGRLNERIAIITGAGSGIGRATAQRFAREGARLVLADVNAQALAETVASLEIAPERVRSMTADVSREDQVKALVDEAVAAFGRLDIMCNNAGVSSSREPATEQDGEEWRRVLDVNLLGVVFGMKHAGRVMAAQRSGAIVNTASVAGIRAGAGGNPYSASKAAVINATMTAACDLGEFGVRVNAVCPGLTETGMTKPIFDYARDLGKEHKLGSRCELRRFGRPEELASAILFLASDDASYVTGQALAVDGGNTASLNLPGMKV